MTASRVRGIDLAARGIQHGTIDVVHSDDRHEYGVIPVPIAVMSGGDGPTALLLAGTHGDEYEGQVLLHRLIRELELGELRGRLIVVPALNLPAVRAASRVSGLDGGNLNRTYPGDRAGTSTEQIADCVVRDLLPHADLALDLHSGGSSAVYLPSSFVYANHDESLMARHRHMAEQLGLPWAMVVPPRFEPHSFSTAAADAGVPMIATEIGGGGAVDPLLVAQSFAGLRRLLVDAAILAPQDAPDARPDPPRWISLDGDAAVRTPIAGLFEPIVGLGAHVIAGELIARVHPVEELGRRSSEVHAARDGVVAIMRRPPLVELGAHLFTIASHVDSVSGYVSTHPPQEDSP